MCDGRELSVGDYVILHDGQLGGEVAELTATRARVRVYTTGGHRWVRRLELDRMPTPAEANAYWAAKLAPAPELGPDVLAQQPQLFGDDEAGAPEDAPLIVIPCGAAKLPHAAPAGDLYTGAQHVLTRQAADTLAAATGGRVVILSARHGLLDLHDVIAPYDLKLGDVGSITAATVTAQLATIAPARIVALLPKAYAGLLRVAAAPLHVELFDVLAGSRGLLEQRAILARVKRGEVKA